MTTEQEREQAKREDEERAQREADERRAEQERQLREQGTEPSGNVSDEVPNRGTKQTDDS